MKNSDTDNKNTVEIRDLVGLDAEGDEVIKTVEGCRHKPSGDQGEGYRIWRCNGVSIGVHIHKKKP